MVSVLEQLRCTCGEKARAEVAALSPGRRGGCCPPAERWVSQDAVEGRWQDLELRLEGVGLSGFILTAGEEEAGEVAGKAYKLGCLQGPGR